MRDVFRCFNSRICKENDCIGKSQKILPITSNLHYRRCQQVYDNGQYRVLVYVQNRYEYLSHNQVFYIRSFSVYIHAYIHKQRIRNFYETFKKRIRNVFETLFSNEFETIAKRLRNDQETFSKRLRNDKKTSTERLRNFLETFTKRLRNFLETIAKRLRNDKKR